MPSENLITDHLRLEPWSDSHTALLVELAASTEVTRFIGDGVVWSRSRALEAVSRSPCCD